MKNLIPEEHVQNKIYLIRGQKVMLDKDLASLYKVNTFVLNQAVKRNINRFPIDFMFQLTPEEAKALRSHFVILDKGISKRGRHSKYLPFAFTEQGIAMLSGILHSKRAVHVNIAIMRAFVKLRFLLSSHKELANKLKELEGKFEKHNTEIQAIFNAIKQLLTGPEKTVRRIGFISPESKKQL